MRRVRLPPRRLEDWSELLFLPELTRLCSLWPHLQINQRSGSSSTARRSWSRILEVSRRGEGQHSAFAPCRAAYSALHAADIPGTNQGTLRLAARTSP